ncbi:MAG: hypothetical protein WCO56_00345 [Verrucomicrobiota bacterium]
MTIVDLLKLPRLAIGVVLLVLAQGAGAAAVGGASLDTYNYVIGTQTIGASYQFTKEPKLVETARAILAMGSSTLKFSLTPQGGVTPKPRTLAETAERDPAVRAVFELPFAHYVMWVSPLSAPGGGAFAAKRLGAEREETYELAKYLLKTYNGTGKSFYLGNWEGDWLLTHTNPKYVPSTEEVQDMINWANTRQKAVDDARRETPHANVYVYYYIEVNRVRDAMEGKVRVANKVLPQTNPDFVSYSSYDAQHGDIEKSYAESLDYLQARLTPKPAIPGKRVFIGEYGMLLLGNTAQAQATLARHVMRAGLSWGCPFILYWEMYNNEVTPEGRQRGFWLIDDQGIKQPVYFTHQKFLEQARAYVADFTAKHGRAPNREEFGRAGLAWLPAETVPPASVPLVQGSPFVDALRDFSNVFSHTDNLIFDSSNPDYFEGRMQRLRRSGTNMPQHVVYRGNAISRFKITTYVTGTFAGKAGPKVRIFTSADKQQWHEVDIAKETVAIKSGWSRVVLMPVKELAVPAAYLKIELSSDAAIYSPQVGEVQLFTAQPALPR